MVKNHKMKKILLKTKKIYDLLDIILLKYQKKCDSKINIYLKYALKIIYNFNKNKKKIWFIGFTSYQSTGRIYNSKHVFLSNNFWIKGLIGNKKFTKVKSKVYNLTQTPDLVVIFDNGVKITTNILKEFVKQDIPIIIFGSSLRISLKSSYIIFVPIFNFEKKIKSFCFFLVHAILKNNVKKKKI